MKTKILLLETIIAILAGVITLLYRWHMLQNIPDFGGKDIIYSLIIIPVFFFALAYILGRWIFHFVVLEVHQKGIRVLLLLEAVVMCLYAGMLIFFAFIKYSNSWMENHTLQSCYAHILVFCGSTGHIIICIFAGMILALAMTGRRIQTNTDEIVKSSDNLKGQ